MRLFVLFVVIALCISFPLQFVHGTTLIQGNQVAIVSNSTDVSGMVQRAYGIISGVSALIIAILWVPIALGYFSKDLDRKADAKERTKDALIGTVIFVMAVSGVLYAVVHYIVAG